MRKATWLAVLLALVSAAAAEEILLKDGTKVVGRMVAIKGDKIEVETRFGKMMVRRDEVQSITFPENNQRPAPAPEPKASVPQVEEELDGTHYVNRTGRFTLTVPIEWKINPDLRSGDIVAGLTSRNGIHFVAVAQETVSATLDGYKGVVDLQLRTNLLNFAKVSESATTIDGQPAVLLSYKGTTEEAGKLPIHFLTAIIAYDDLFVRITAWCIEPLFGESQRTFEAILNSYRRLPDQKAQAISPKRPAPAESRPHALATGGQ